MCVLKWKTKIHALFLIVLFFLFAGIYESSIFAQKYICLDRVAALDNDPTTETIHTSGRNTSEALAQRGDFDGDDNTIIANRGLLAEAEVARLMTPQAVFVSSKDGSACMYPTQDSALGLWALTMHSPACPPLVLNMHTVQNLLFEIDVSMNRGHQMQRVWNEYSRLHSHEPHVVVVEALCDTLRKLQTPFLYTSMGLFSAMLPADLSYSDSDIVITKGVLVSGHAHVDVWSRHLLPFVYRVFGSDAAVRLLDRAEKLGALVAERIGPSISCFANREMIAESKERLKKCVSEARNTALCHCNTMAECETRSYILHHKLLAVQQNAQKITKKFVVDPLHLLERRSAISALRTVLCQCLGYSVECFERSVSARIPEQGIDYKWVREHSDDIIRTVQSPESLVRLALAQPRWTLARWRNAEFASPTSVFGPQPSLEQHSRDADMRVHAFAADVDPTAMYCTGSRSISIGTVSQMMCAVGQLFSDNGDIANRNGETRIEMHCADSDNYNRSIFPAHVASRFDWCTMSPTIGSENTGMVSESFTHGLSPRAMHIMGGTIRSTMANSGNGTRRAGHLARLIMIYGENFSVHWDGAMRDNSRILCPRFGQSGMWSSRKVETPHGDMPIEPRGLADAINARYSRLKQM